MSYAIILLFILVVVIFKDVYQALGEITCAVFDETDNYREKLINEAFAYGLLVDFIDDSDIYEGMTVIDVDKLLQERCKGNYSDRSLSYYFGDYLGVKKPEIKKKVVIIRNPRTFPRHKIKIVIKKGKIVKIKKLEGFLFF